MKGFKEYDKYITPMADNNDVQKILKRYLRRGDGKPMIIEYPQEVPIQMEIPNSKTYSGILEAFFIVVIGSISDFLIFSGGEL